MTIELMMIEELCDSNDGPWSSLDDAGDAKDAKDEAPCGHAGSNDVPDSDCMLEDAEPHELDDKLGLGGQTPSPQVGVDYDVSARHQSQNCLPCPPLPTYLAGTGSSEKHRSKKLHSNMVSHVQGRLHSEEDCSGNSLSLVSEHHAFLSLLWCKLLDEAKGRMQLYVAMEVPFLCHEMAINSVCMEILVEMVIKYEDNGLELEAEHKRLMATILFHDTQTFHSEIEKVTMHIVPFEDLDSLGRTSNFAHSTLKKTCLTIYYCTSSKSLHQFAEFQESVPMKALTLVAAIIRSVVMTFKKHGVAKNETLCGDEVEDAYNNITHLVNQVWCDDYHRSKLNKMLQEWAKAGLLAYTVGCCTVNRFCARLCTTDREGPSCYGVAAVTCCNRLDSGEGI
ncbi:hypothetical protein F5141DRAFT_1060787 [Pisolithus sp. B1]|nr:hypothetical protein F5141DRAFT_1060787 [Pisolithus sp. B1]